MAVPRISKEDLKQRLEAAADDRPVVLDVSFKYPYEHSTAILPGAIRAGPGMADAAALPRDRDIVLYDSDPRELVAEHVGADLIAKGFRARVLAGGIGDWL